MIHYEEALYQVNAPLPYLYRSVQSEVEHMTDIVADVHIRPTAYTFCNVPGVRSAAQHSRGHSRSPDQRSSRHVRPSAGDVNTAQSPPPVPPSVPTPFIDQYLSSDDESSTSSASTLPPGQQDPPPSSVPHRTSSGTSRSTVETRLYLPSRTWYSFTDPEGMEG